MDGRLSKTYAAVAGKILSATEVVSAGVSKSEAMNTGKIRDVLPYPAEDKVTYRARSLYLTDDREPIDVSTWYTHTDVRRNNPNRAPETRLNYASNDTIMSEHAAPGDCWWVARRTDDDLQLLTVVAPCRSEVATRLDRLFGTNLCNATTVWGKGTQLTDGDVETDGLDDLDLDDAVLLDELGVEVTDSHYNLYDHVMRRLIDEPVSETTNLVSSSALIRAIMASMPDTDPHDGDEAIYAWMVAADEIFHRYEREARNEQAQTILDDDIIDFDAMIRLAKSILNSRKSRVGRTFEICIARVLRANDVHFTPGKQVDKGFDGTRPDFLLPSLEDYADPTFPTKLLTYLGAKTTLKERWMQVRTEGNRITTKHLITMDRDLTNDVISRMKNKDVIPIIPDRIINRRYPTRRDAIMSVADFIEFAKDRQKRASIRQEHSR